MSYKNVNLIFLPLKNCGFFLHVFADTFFRNIWQIVGKFFSCEWFANRLQITCELIGKFMPKLLAIFCLLLNLIIDPFLSKKIIPSSRKIGKKSSSVKFSNFENLYLPTLFN